MSNSLFIIELMILILCGTSLILVMQFLESEYSKLRTLLVFLFLAEFWRAILSGFFFYINEKGWYNPLSFPTFRILALIPVTVVMVLIIYYMKHSKGKL